MMKVLLVDGSKTMLNIQKGILTQLGYTDFEVACDGREALAKAGDYRPDLLLVDWGITDMDALTFVKELRDKGSNAPVIMAATEADLNKVRDAIQSGVNNYVIKPFTPDTLGERIKETLSREAA